MTDKVILEGTFKWTRTTTPDPVYDCWSTAFYPSPDSLIQVMDLQSQGVKNTIKKDEDGYFVSYRRPTKKQVKGKPDIVFEAPKVTLNGGPIGDKLIGNGSKGKLILEVYQHSTPTGGKAKAARLFGIDITELVEYKRNDNGF